MNKRLIKKQNGSCKVKEPHCLTDEPNGCCCNVTHIQIVHQFIHSVSDILILLTVRYLDWYSDSAIC